MNSTCGNPKDAPRHLCTFKKLSCHRGHCVETHSSSVLSTGPRFWLTFSQQRRTEEAVGFCQPRWLRKPFTANKLALFRVTTCLSRSARVLTLLRPPRPSSLSRALISKKWPQPSSVRRLPRYHAPVSPAFLTVAGLIVHLPSLRSRKIVSSPAVWKKKRKI